MPDSYLSQVVPDPHFLLRLLEQERKQNGAGNRQNADMGFRAPTIAASPPPQQKPAFMDRVMTGLIGQPDSFDGLLSDGDLASARHKAMMAMASSLLSNSGWSSTPRTTGEIVGGAMTAGGSAQDDALTAALQKVLLKQKLNERPTPKAHVVNGALVREDGEVIYNTPRTAKPMDPLSQLQADFDAGLITRDDFQARRKAIINGTAPVSVNVNTDKSLYGTLADKQAAQYSDLYSQAQSAPERIIRAQRVKRILDEGAYTGAAANFKLGFGKAARELGYDMGSEVENTEALAADLAASTLEAIKSSGLGAGSGFSNADRDFLEKVTGGKLTLEANTLRRLADLNERAARVTVQRWNSTARRLKPELLDQLGMGTVEETGNGMGNGWSIEPVR
jgi:hypothetical protein